MAAWGPDEWGAASQLVLSVGAVIAGGWAVFNYRRTKRADATRWMVEFFRGFYVDDRFYPARDLLEYHCHDRLIPLLELRVFDRSVELTAQQRDDMTELDLLLNYFEQILYLEDQKIINSVDREVFFQYWFSIFDLPGYSGMRRYLARCGFERIAKSIGAPASEHVVFYGTLMSEYSTQDRIGIAAELKRVGSCTLDGVLYRLPTCPGLRPGDGRVDAELFRILDESVVAVLDEFEDYDASNQDDSRFLRRSLYVPEYNVDAWVYYISEDEVAGLEPISNGSWRQHRHEEEASS